MSSTTGFTISNEEIDTLCAFALKLADAAADVTISYFKSPIGVSDKDKGEGFDPVTAADKGAEEAVRTLIEKHYPDHAVHGEEMGIKETGSPFKWVLDPVDGTRAFISGLPTWGTLIALLYKDEPLIGVIDQPYIKERYLGWPGGATLNGREIKTRACTTLASATLSSTDPGLFSGAERTAFDKLTEESRLTRYGLDCYAYAVLAAGHMDIVVETGLKPYDMMALIPVIRGAGGAATNWQGDAPGKPGDKTGRLLAVGDPALIAEAEAILSAAV